MKHIKKISLAHSYIIDRIMGVPLCVLITAWDAIIRSRSKRKQETRSRAVCFIKLSELGALIVALPLLETVFERIEKKDAFMVMFAENAEFFQCVDYFLPQNVLKIRRDTLLHACVDIVNAMRVLRTKKLSIIYDLEFFSRCSALLSYFSGALFRVGFGSGKERTLYRGHLYTHEIPYSQQDHMAENYSKFAVVLPPQQTGTKKAVSTRVVISEDAVRRVIEKLQRKGCKTQASVFLFNVDGGELPLREWPLIQYKAVAETILRKKECVIVLIGTEHARMKSEQLCTLMNDKRVISMAGETTLLELFALMSMSAGLVGSDSGIAHMAGLISLPQVILFGPETPEIFSPRSSKAHSIYKKKECSPCYSILTFRQSRCTYNACMHMIDPEEVSESCLHFLS